MTKKFLSAFSGFVSLAITAHAQVQVVINEIESDTFNTPATDYAEFIELFSLSGMTTPLDGLTLVLFNGGTAAGADVSYRAFDLDGFSTDSSGYFLFGTTNIAGAHETSFLGTGNILQNGADAVALYRDDAANFPNGTAPTTTNLLDVIVYGTDDPVDDVLLSSLGETMQFNEGPNPGSDAANMSLSLLPNGTGEFALTTPTPGVANVPEPSTVALLGAGAVMGLLRRRRR